MKSIAGFLDVQKVYCLEENKPHLADILERMNSRAANISVDVWQHNTSKGPVVILGHAGHPKTGCSTKESAEHKLGNSLARFDVVFDGYLINRKELIQAYDLHAQALDEEIIAYLFTIMDPIKACRALNGGFALALWDQQEQALYMARDRVGVRPLFWGKGHKGSILFGSCLKRFFYDVRFTPRLSQKGVSCFLQMGYMPDAVCILENVHKVIPGEVVRIDRHGHTQQDRFVKWEEFYENTQIQDISAKEGVSRFKSVIENSVQGCIGEAASVGIFLSSGLDSSLLTAVAQTYLRKTRGQTVSTFTMGFQEEDLNEADKARLIAHHLGTDHHELYLTPTMAQDVLKELPVLWSEPFSDSSQVAVAALDQWVKQQGIDVALGGEGASIFLGSKRVDSLASKWRYLEKVPFCLRYGLGSVLLKLGVSRWGKRWDRFFEYMKSEDFSDFFPRSYNIYDLNPEKRKQEDWVPENPFKAFLGRRSYEQIAAYMNLFMYVSWDMLTKTSRGGMGCFLDIRMPFIDERVIHQVLSLPEAYHCRGNQTKWLSRQVLGQYLPEPLFNFPKRGFPIPLGRWLRGAFRETVGHYFSVDWMEDINISSKMVEDLWTRHLKGTADHERRLWSLFILLQWCDQWKLRSLS